MSGSIHDDAARSFAIGFYGGLGVHGRGAEVDELIGRLRAGEREIFVIGPSGSGQSSLVAAGGLAAAGARHLRGWGRSSSGLSGLASIRWRACTRRWTCHPPGQSFVAADLIAALLAHRGRDSSRDEEHQIRAALHTSGWFGASDILGSEHLLYDIETWLAAHE